MRSVSNRCGDFESVYPVITMAGRAIFRRSVLVDPTGAVRGTFSYTSSQEGVVIQTGH